MTLFQPHYSILLTLALITIVHHHYPLNEIPQIFIINHRYPLEPHQGDRERYGDRGERSGKGSRYGKGERYGKDRGSWTKKRAGPPGTPGHLEDGESMVRMVAESLEWGDEIHG